MKPAPTGFRFARHIIAFAIVVGAYGFLFMLVYRAVPESNRDTINLAIGFVLGLLTSVGAYYFGSSKDKSDSDFASRQEATTADVSTTITTETVKKSEEIQTMKPEESPIPKRP